MILQSDIDFLTGDNSKALDELARITSSSDATAIRVDFNNVPRAAVAGILMDVADAKSYTEGQMSLQDLANKISVQVNWFPVKNIKVSIGSN